MSKLRIKNRSESDLLKNPVEASDFFSGFVCNWLLHNCEDHFHFILAAESRSLYNPELSLFNLLCP